MWFDKKTREEVSQEGKISQFCAWTMVVVFKKKTSIYTCTIHVQYVTEIPYEWHDYWYVPLPLGISGNWIEIAYGTSSGTVRVIVQHPETVGSGPQLFQTFTVHRSPITKVMLSEKHLVSGKCPTCCNGINMQANCTPQDGGGWQGFNSSNFFLVC